MIRGAVLSSCGRYRWLLTRSWGTRSPRETDLVFVGCNPSTADEHADDATVRKWAGFAGRWGFTGFTVVNAFGWRATDVAELVDVSDPVGPRCDHHLIEAARRAQLVVPCWGSASKLPPRLRPRLVEVAATLRRVEAHRHGRFRAFGYTNGGDPAHPLMLAYATPLVPWPAGA